MKIPTVKKYYKTSLNVGTKVNKLAKTAVIIGRPLDKYQNEIKTGLKYGAKAGKFLAKHGDDINKLYDVGSKYASKYASSGKSMSFTGALADATVGYAKRRGEKYLDKKLGNYKAYRIIKAGADLAYDAATGNPMAALKHGANLYEELDPNKKRAAKIAGTVRGSVGLVGSVASGNAKGAFDNGLALYSIADKNKKRVAAVNDFDNHYVQPTYGFVKSSNELDKEINRKSFR